jgi:hypothetical protein
MAKLAVWLTWLHTLAASLFCLAGYVVLLAMLADCPGWLVILDD